MSELHTQAPPPVRAGRPRWLIAALAALAALVVIVVVLVAVGAYLLGQQGGDTPPKAAPPPRLDSPQVIVDRLAELGMPCANLDPISNPVGAVARSSCYVGTDQVTISVYASHEDVEAQWEMHKALLLGEMDAALVIGDIWTLNPDDREWGKRAAELLGAEFRES